MEVRSPNAGEEKLKLKASAELEADRVRLLMDHPFVGAILIRQNLIPVEQTIEIAGILDAVVKGMAQPGSWITVK